jgi:hypothetical protein
LTPAAGEAPATQDRDPEHAKVLRTDRLEADARIMRGGRRRLAFGLEVHLESGWREEWRDQHWCNGDDPGDLAKPWEERIA